MLHRLQGQELILFLAVSVLFLFMFRGTGTTVLFARGSCDSVINILCYVDVAYSYTLPATVYL